MGSLLHQDEISDFEYAIKLVANGKIYLEPFIMSVNTLPGIGVTSSEMGGNQADMKTLRSCDASDS